MGSITIKSHVFFLWKSSSRPLQSKQMWYKGIYVSTYGKSVFAQEEEKCVSVEFSIHLIKFGPYIRNSVKMEMEVQRFDNVWLPFSLEEILHSHMSKQ